MHFSGLLSHPVEHSPINQSQTWNPFTVKNHATLKSAHMLCKKILTKDWFCSVHITILPFLSPLFLSQVSARTTKNIHNLQVESRFYLVALLGLELGDSSSGDPERADSKEVGEEPGYIKSAARGR